MSIKKPLTFIAFIYLLLCAQITLRAQNNDCKPIDFNLPHVYQTDSSYGSSPTLVDLDTDGNKDLVAIHSQTKSVSVVYGDGVRGFTPSRQFPTEIALSTLTTGDLNRDGKPDLIGAATYNNKLVVLLNDGRGGFLPPSVSTFPTTVYDFYNLAVGDFNGDGNLDVFGVTSTNLNFFLGNGQGELGFSSNVNWKGNKGEIVVGDFNKDGLADLAVTNRDNYPWGIGIVLGNRVNAFVISTILPLNEQPTGIKIGDFNNDNLTDIVIAAYYPYQNSTPQTFYLQPWLGDGAGNFTAGTKVQLPYMNDGVTVGDFNGDGKQDLATKLSYSMIAVTNGNGDGTFQSPTHWATTPSHALLTVNVNKDDKDDLLTFYGAYPHSILSVFLSGTTGFETSRATPNGMSEIETADFNNDGYRDFISTYRTDYSSADIFIALNDKKGGLLPDWILETPGRMRALKVGDFNGDGKSDALTAHSTNTNQLAVYLGNGAGTVSAPIFSSFSGTFKTAIVADFNADGKDDIFVATEGNARVYSLLGNGNGTFTVAPNFPLTLEQDAYRLAKGDFNADGKIDLVISNGTQPALWLGTGSGQFNRSDVVIPNLSSVTAGDYNGDGRLDLAGFDSGSVKAVLGDGNGGFSESFSSPIQGNGTNYNSMTSADFNLDGADDLAYVVEQREINNLVIVPSAGRAANGWSSPLFYTVAGMDGYYSSILAVDFTADNKPDIGYNAGSSRGFIVNTSGTKPCLSIDDVTVTEGDGADTAANFKVSLSAASSTDVYVNYILEEQTAQVPADINSVSGRLKIPAGETSATISLAVKGDLLDESDETFLIKLSGVENASLIKSSGAGKIIDNDAEPTLSISNVSAVEGFGSQSFAFKVNLSAPSSKQISFRYETSNGTAIAGKDYNSLNYTLFVPPGNVSADLYVSVIGDNIYEPNENFFLRLSEATNATIAVAQAEGIIVNDDVMPTVSVFSNTVTEGDTGTRQAQITLQLSNASYLPITLNVLTSDGTAIGGKDFTESNAVVTIPAEQQSVTTSVQILSDTINEPNETFFINIHNPINTTISIPQSQIAIIDDEFVSNDFDRDGKTDIAVFRPNIGTWYTLFSSNNAFSASPYGFGSDKVVSGDYNGDGRTDIAVWRPSSGIWYTPVPNRTQQWGASEDIPVPGDYDNDGRTDVAVFRPSTRTWYIRLSSNNQFSAVQFGESTDRPVPADYDGDGKTDVAVYRPETGMWYGLRSSNDSFFALQFGMASDKTVPADYDGDGRDDIAVFRNGIWYVMRSSDNKVIDFQWGMEGDKPVPGNYDGDDKSDFAIYRAGVWWIWLSSTNNYMSTQFGMPDDIPIPFAVGN